MAGKSGFSASEFEEIKRLYLSMKVALTHRSLESLGKGVRRLCVMLWSKPGSGGLLPVVTPSENFKPGQSFGRVTLVKRLVKSKKLRYHVVCDCGYEFDVDPYLLTLAEGHKQRVSGCSRCMAGDSGARH